MIEKIVCGYLSEKLDVSVFMEEPEKPPGSYALIEKIGSDENDHVSTAVIAVRSYAGSLCAAAELNHSVKRAMYGLSDLPEISRCKLNSDYNYTDTSTRRYRYQAVFDIIFYEE